MPSHLFRSSPCYLQTEPFFFLTFAVCTASHFAHFLTFFFLLNRPDCESWGGFYVHSSFYTFHQFIHTLRLFIFVHHFGFVAGWALLKANILLIIAFHMVLYMSPLEWGKHMSAARASFVHPTTHTNTQCPPTQTQHDILQFRCGFLIIVCSSWFYLC